MPTEKELEEFKSWLVREMGFSRRSAADVISRYLRLTAQIPLRPGPPHQKALTEVWRMFGLALAVQVG